MITMILELTEEEHELMQSGNIPMSVLEKLLNGEVFREINEVTEHDNLR